MGNPERPWKVLAKVVLFPETFGEHCVFFDPLQVEKIRN
jgi:hypothetical protein